MEQAVAERLQQGIDSAVDLNKARLTVARVRLHQAEARGSADVLRRHLSNLTGVPASNIDIAPETIPALPPAAPKILPNERSLPARPLRLPKNILSQSQCAPSGSIALIAVNRFLRQYARFSTFNHYAEYLPQGSFRPDNATIGVALKIPLFNASQRARADAARLKL